MSFQRTRMSADRTLMSVIRTSLSLIGFGFTIYQVFQKLHESEVLKSSAAATHFGVALVLLGITMLLVGIAYHASFMVGLRRERTQMKADGLVHAESQLPGFADAVGGSAASGDRFPGHREYGVPCRAVRLIGITTAKSKATAVANDR